MMKRNTSERILDVLRPYASNWSGSLGRGDLVIPQREIPHLIQEILQIVHEGAGGASREVGEMELFEALAETRRLPSVQDQAATLRRSFRILRR